MKIAILGPTYPFRGGIVHYNHLLYNNLRGKAKIKLFGFKRQYPRLIFPGKTDRDMSKRPPSFIGEVDYTLDSLNPISWIQTAARIIKFNPDLIITHWWVVFWVPQIYVISRLLNRRLGRKILFLCHNVTEHEPSRWKEIGTRCVLKNGKSFLVHSAEEAKRLRDMLPNAEVIQAEFPRLNFVVPKGLTKEEARKELGIHGDVILFFGFVRPYKGLQILLEALPLVLEKREIQLLTVGEFWQDKQMYLDIIGQKKLDSYVKIVDRYVPDEDLELYFSAANVMIMPYVSVTGSGAVQLAFSFNLPVIVSKIGALAEVVEDGVTGLHVPPSNSKALALRIIEYFEKGYEDHFRENILLNEQRFSWENLINKMLQTSIVS